MPSHPLKFDDSTEQIAAYVNSVSYEHLTPEVVVAVKNRIIDTLGCGVAAFDSEPVKIARRLAVPFDSTPNARIIGSLVRTTPECAAFANGMMCRYLDLNDAYQWIGGGHPSDDIAGILAAAEAFQASGKNFITAIAVAYEIHCYLIERVALRSKGWDTSICVTLGTAIGVGKLLNFDRETLGNCISLAIVPNISLNETRIGNLSMWKAGSAANAARQGLFASLLARAGMTGPSFAIEGDDGFQKRITGHFELDSTIQTCKTSRVQKTFIKKWPVRRGVQLPIDTALQIHQKLNGEEVRELILETYDRTFKMNVDPDQWAPKNRETADHSLPYCVAAAIMDGDINSKTFMPERYLDPRLLNLTRRVQIKENMDFTKAYPNAFNCRITVTTESDKTISAHLTLTQDGIADMGRMEAVEAKFNRLTGSILTPQRRKEFIDCVNSLEMSDDAGKILDYLCI